MFLEVIAKNLVDAKAINQSGANRIELCKDLEVGGLTPEKTVIDEVVNYSKIPVNVIVRPTERDFYYTNEELDQMIRDIKYISTTKANGVVIGVLNQDNTINEDFLKRVNEVRKHLDVTFHKAFDEVKDMQAGLEVLNKYNITNVLTSGGPSITEGLNILNNLNKSNIKVKILIGGGVKLDNIQKVLLVSDQVHIGTAARVDGTWNSLVDIDKIKGFLNYDKNN